MKKITIALLAILYVIPSFSQTMEWHIKDNYVDVKYMGNNLFKVKNSKGKWGVINEYGETTVAIQYDSITPIVENRALLLDTTYFIIFLSLYSKSLMKLVVRSIPPWIPCNLAFTYEIIFIFFFTNFFPEFDHISPYTVILLTSILGFLEFMI